MKFPTTLQIFDLNKKNSKLHNPNKIHAVLIDRSNGLLMNKFESSSLSNLFIFPRMNYVRNKLKKLGLASGRHDDKVTYQKAHTVFQDDSDGSMSCSTSPSNISLDTSDNCEIWNENDNDDKADCESTTGSQSSSNHRPKVYGCFYIFISVYLCP